MFVPLLLAAVVAPPAPPVFPAFRTQLFTPLPPRIAQLLGEGFVPSRPGFPLVRVGGVTVTLPTDFRVL